MVNTAPIILTEKKMQSSAQDEIIWGSYANKSDTDPDDSWSQGSYKTVTKLTHNTKKFWALVMLAGGWF